MGTTSLKPHLRNGNGESLSRAKATLKDRLKQKMMQEVLEELQDDDQVVQEAVEATSWDQGALAQTKEAYKMALLDAIRQQAVAEVVADLNASDPQDQAVEGELTQAVGTFKAQLYDHLLQEALSDVGHSFKAAETDPASHALDLSEASQALKESLRTHIYKNVVSELAEEVKTDTSGLQALANDDDLAGAKNTLKEQLLDRVYQQAIQEIDAEVDIEGVDLMTDAYAEDAQEDATSISDFSVELPDDDTFNMIEAPPEGFGPAAKQDEEDLDLNVKFWEEGISDLPSEETPDATDSTRPEEAPEEDTGFFLDGPVEAGTDYEGQAENEAVVALFDDLMGFEDGDDWDIAASYEDNSSVKDSEDLEDQVQEPPEAAAAEEEKVPGDVFAYYVYGVFSNDTMAPPTTLTHGIDPDHEVYLVHHDEASALVSKVMLDEYGEEALAMNLLNPVWKEERTAAHHDIVDHMDGKGLFLPLPFCTVFANEDEIHEAFTKYGYLDALQRIQDRNQWHVRLYRNVDVLHQHVVENSEAVQQLMADIKSKARKGGQSIKKQMVETIHQEEAAWTDSCTNAVHEQLFSRADDVELGSLDVEHERDRLELILDATYLIHRDAQTDFVADIEELESGYAIQGFEFEVFGPSAPTKFAHLSTTPA